MFRSVPFRFIAYEFVPFRFYKISKMFRSVPFHSISSESVPFRFYIILVTFRFNSFRSVSTKYWFCLVSSISNWSDFDFDSLRSVPFHSVPFRSVPFQVEKIRFRFVPFRSVSFCSVPKWNNFDFDSFRSVSFCSVPFHYNFKFDSFRFIPFQMRSVSNLILSIGGDSSVLERNGTERNESDSAGLCSRCTLAYLSLPSGSSESPTPECAEGASCPDGWLPWLGGWQDGWMGGD